MWGRWCAGRCARGAYRRFLKLGSKPRVAGVCSFFGDQWGVNVKEVRKSGIVARQEIIKRIEGLRTSLESLISLRKA